MVPVPVFVRCLFCDCEVTEDMSYKNSFTKQYVCGRCDRRIERKKKKKYGYISSSGIDKYYRKMKHKLHTLGIKVVIRYDDGCVETRQ